MQFKEVYIINTASYLPNEPVSNEEMEEYLGLINARPSKSKRIVLRKNGIKSRFYAIDKAGKPTHTNAEMTALAVRALFSDNPDGLKSFQLLSCGTSSPDQMIPSHAVMVHGWLPETAAIEVVSPSGVCCAGMHALKYAYMAVRTGDVESAVTSGSERISRVLRSEAFEDEVQKLAQLEENPYIGFEKEFLRWMLSDGAAAFLLSSQKKEDGINLRIEWMEGVSYANTMEVSMYMGSEKTEDGILKGYMDYTPEEIMNQSILSLKQDVKLLSEFIVSMGTVKLKTLFAKKGLTANDIDYFLPHMSSEFFRTKIAEHLELHGLGMATEKWFTNLDKMGNVGSGSVYLMVDELFKSGVLKKGERILLLVPESARFSYMFSLLTVC